MTFRQPQSAAEAQAMGLPYGGGLMGRKRGLFGATMPTVPQTPDTPPMTGTAQPLAPKKGFDWGKLIGVLGDSLSIAGGGQAQYVPNLLERRQLQDARQYAEQTYQRRRQDDLADYGVKQEIEAKYAKPPAPYRWESNNGSLLELGPDGQPKVVYEDPTPKINWVRADNGDGTFTMVPMGPNGPINVPGQAPQSGAPIAPKGKLTPYNGGQTATPSGTFQR